MKRLSLCVLLLASCVAPPSVKVVPLGPAQYAVAVVLGRDADGNLMIPVRGVSMEPYIKSGDVLQVVPATPEALTPGAVAVFRSPSGMLICHQIYSVRGGKVSFVGYIEGRAVNDRHGWIDPKDILYIVRYVGRVSYE